jgi:hypothetical protein
MADGVWGQGAWLIAFLVVQRLGEMVLARLDLSARGRASGIEQYRGVGLHRPHASLGVSVG